MKKKPFKKKRNKKIILAWTLVFSVIVVVSALIVYSALTYSPPPEEPLRTAAGTYDKVGTDDYFVWNDDGTGYSWRGGIKYEGTWEQNATYVIVNYAGAPPNLTYKIVENGVMWNDVLYIKRVD